MVERVWVSFTLSWWVDETKLESKGHKQKTKETCCVLCRTLPPPMSVVLCDFDSLHRTVATPHVGLCHRGWWHWFKRCLGVANQCQLICSLFLCFAKSCVSFICTQVTEASAEKIVCKSSNNSWYAAMKMRRLRSWRKLTSVIRYYITIYKWWFIYCPWR